MKTLVIYGCATLLTFLCPLPQGEVSSPVVGIYHYVLPNGVHLIVAERPKLQLAAVNLTVNLGSIDDPQGQSGMAHLLEHVTLSGSTTVGSLNPQAEAVALAELDKAYAAMERERRNPEPVPGVLAGLERRFEEEQDACTRTAEEGEILGGRLESRGAIGLNATTTADATQFFGSLPISEIEFWMSLEANRLRHPILRRFYIERNVVLREVATLTGGKPTIQERLLQELFPGSPVAQSAAGDLEQIRSIDRPAALDYFQRYYRPENVAIAVVGNVVAEEVHRLCLRYFGNWQPDGPSELPRSRKEHSSALRAPVVRSFNNSKGPVVFFVVPQPVNETTKAATALDAVAELLNSDDLSPLKRQLVEQRALAWNVGASANYPSLKQTRTFLVHVYGSLGTAQQTLLKATSGLLRSLDSIPDEDLQGAIWTAEVRFAMQLDDPPTLASLLSFYEAVQGDWTVPFHKLEELGNITPENTRAVARALFNRIPDTPISAGRK